MAIVTRGYPYADFVRLKGFDLSELADLYRLTREKDGYLFKVGREKKEYFIHPIKGDLVVLETDDKTTKDRIIRKIATFVKGRRMKLESAMLDTAEAYEYLSSFEKGGMLVQGHLHLHFRDSVPRETPSGIEQIYRTKILWRNRDVAEGRGLSTKLGWEVTGADLLIERGEDRHYGFVRFAEPTARISKGPPPVSENLHELLAKRLVDSLTS